MDCGWSAWCGSGSGRESDDELDDYSRLLVSVLVEMLDGKRIIWWLYDLSVN